MISLLLLGDLSPSAMRRKVAKMKIQISDLNDVKVGDLLCDNVTKKPMRVMAVSENYLYGIQKNFDKEYYTIYAKEPEGIYHDGNGCHMPIKNGEKFFFRGPGNTCGIDGDLSPEEILKEFEKGEIDISWKKRVSLLEIYKVVRK